MIGADGLMTNYNRFSVGSILGGNAAKEELRQLKVVLDAKNKEINELKKIIYSQDDIVNDLYAQLGVSRQAPGRKSRFDEVTKLRITEQRKQGTSINKLAQEYECSTSVIGRITKDIKMDLRKTSNEK